MIFTRESYYPAASAEAVDAEGTDAAVFTYEKDGEPYAIAFHGRAQRPDWHHRFGNAEARAAHVARFIEARRAHAERKARARAERNQPHPLKVGSVLSASWGYDQTNIDFFEVVAVNGPHTVTVRKVAAETTEHTGYMQGTAKAIPGEYIGEPLRRRADATGYVRINSVVRAGPWDGKPRHWSSYA